MKWDINFDIFIKRIEHIVVFNKLVENGSLYPELFKNYKSCSYNDYNYRAVKRNLEFNITPEEFDNYVLGDCYICGCGKITNINHRNGVDRFDNTKGYTIENCRSCCSNCNYLKRDYNYKDFIDKCAMIYNNGLKCKSN